MNLSAILFDLDGTLVDSERMGLDVLFDQAQGWRFPWSRQEMHHRFRGVPMAQCVAEIARHAPTDLPVLDEVQFLKDLRLAMAAQRYLRRPLKMAEVTVCFPATERKYIFRIF